ncbi:MAG TPA: UdgX family uracil-DNA binding protein [Actinomycetota bacterium]|nr:UdgX family uracil-DNA binding protein [Actinomycetota bacterium]
MSAADFIPPGATLDQLRRASGTCRGCDLWENATQTVFGAGPASAAMMLVGEQPGDREDREGSPFVGPAGRLLDEALEAAGVTRADVYVSNVVKHFKWTARGKRRIHQKPNAQEISACVPWLREELARVHPQVLVCLGATAAQALLGRTFKVTQHRGEPVESDLAPCVMATVHPSSILRSRDDESRRLEMKAFIGDLEAAAAQLPAR